MSTGTPDSPMADCPSCPCPQLDQFWSHVQRSEWSQVRELLDHMDGCGHWLKAISAGAAADQQVDWVDRLSEDFPLQRTSGLFTELGVNDRWSAVLDLCPVDSLRDDLKGLLVMGFVRHGLGDLSLRVLQRESVSDSQPIDWRQRCVIEFAMTEYFQHQSSSWGIFIAQFPNKFDPSTRPLFRETITKCIELDDFDCFDALCQKWCRLVKPDSRKMISEDVTFAYSGAIEKGQHFAFKLIECRGHTWILFEIVMGKKAWSVLPALCKRLATSCYLEGPKTCLHKMLSDPDLWPGIAPALDQLASKMWQMTTMEDMWTEEPWLSNMSSLKQWCVDTGHAHLAFVLAVVTKDTGLLDRVMTTFTSLQLHKHHLSSALELYADNEMFSSITVMLKTHPVNKDIVEFIPHSYKSKRLMAACESEGVLDWALVLRCSDLAYIQQHHPRCQNSAVLDWILQQSVKDEREIWNIAKELVGRCTKVDILNHVYNKAVWSGQVDMVERLLSRVDPTAHGGAFRYTVFIGRCSKAAKLKMARLCIASGLSTFERKNEGTFSHLFWKPRDHRTPSHLYPDEVVSIDVVKLMIAAGTYSKTFLHDQATKAERSLQTLRSDHPRLPGLETAYSVIREAASTPCRLIHLARLVVSHCIGCRPGRSDRIHSLPLPSSLKDMLSFKDVLQSG